VQNYPELKFLYKDPQQFFSFWDQYSSFLGDRRRLGREGTGKGEREGTEDRR
jgi:hypothetical protein